MPRTTTALVAALALMAVAMARPAKNLLKNSGFEEDWDGDGVPDGWKMLTQMGKPTGARSTENAKAGKACVFADAPDAGTVGYWSQLLALKPGMKRFRLTASARTAGTARANVSFSAYAVGTRKWLAANYALVSVKGKPNWQTRTAEFVVPEGTGSVRIALWGNYGGKGRGRVWFDEVSLQVLDYQRAPASRNLAANADFEAVAKPGQLPKGWAFARSGKQPAKPLPSGGQPHSGRVAPGMEVAAGATGLLWSWAPMAQGWEAYRLSAWVRTEGDARAQGSLSAYSPDKKEWLAAGYGLFDAGTGGRWQRLVGYYQAPPVTGVWKIALWAKGGSKGGRVWFDDVELRPVDVVPASPYVPSNPVPTVSVDDRARGFVVFRRNYLDLMPPSYRPAPDEIGKDFAVAAARGEYEPISIGLYALEDIKTLRIEAPVLRSEAGDTIPASRVDVRVVRYLVKRSHYGMNDRVLAPTYLASTNELRVARGQVGQVWLTVHVPRDAAAGDYHGAVQLTRGDGGSARVPIRLTVHPFTLDEPTGMAFGMYDSLQRTAPGPDFMDVKYRDMRAHGMTTVGFCGNTGARIQIAGGKAEVLFDGASPIEKAMDAYVRAGFAEPIVWLMGGDVRRFCLKQGALESAAFGEAYKSVVAAIVTEGKRRGWPEIIFQPEDEVYAHTTRYKTALRELKLLKQIPGLRTEMDGTNVRPKLTEETYPFTDVLVNCYGPLLYGKRVFPRAEWLGIVGRYRRDHKRLWFYNVDTTGYHVETMRFAAGLYMLWSNADGLLSWAYSWGDDKPYDDYSGNHGDTIFYYPPRRQHKGGPALGWEGLREGVDDYRYARTLTNMIRHAEATGDPQLKERARAAQAMLNGWLARLDLSRLRTNRSMQGNWTERTVGSEGQPAVGGSFKVDVGVTFDDYDRFRSDCVLHILALLKVGR